MDSYNLVAAMLLDYFDTYVCAAYGAARCVHHLAGLGLGVDLACLAFTPEGGLRLVTRCFSRLSHRLLERRPLNAGPFDIKRAFHSHESWRNGTT